MSNKTTITEAQFERTTPLLEFDIVDENGVGFKPETLTLTLYDVESGAIVNSKSAEDVLSSCDDAGHVAYWFAIADTAIQLHRTGKTQETRRALFRWTWSAGARAAAHEIEFTVEDNSQVN